MNVGIFVCYLKLLYWALVVIAFQHSGPAALFISQRILVILNFWGTFWTFWEKGAWCASLPSAWCASLPSQCCPRARSQRRAWQHKECRLDTSGRPRRDAAQSHACRHVLWTASWQKSRWMNQVIPILEQNCDDRKHCSRSCWIQSCVMSYCFFKTRYYKPIKKKNLTVSASSRRLQPTLSLHEWQ